MLTPAPAGAARLVGYDGSNPFNCKLQNVGQGTKFPDPHADPFCVEYDKTHQNITQLGIIDFLSQEPARTAAANDKCFYFQADHWYSSVIQTNQQTAIYNWDGDYFFDKARGVGGAYVNHFAINNSSGDPTALPGFPPEWKPYFSYGRGGVQATDSIPVDPRCVAYAKTHDVYAHPATGRPGSGPAASPRVALKLAYRRGRGPTGRVCARSSLRASLIGPDASRVARVTYRVSGRPVASASSFPFRRVIALVLLSRHHASVLAAQVVMRDGARATLTRRVIACG
jgi:hypothetical protein